jgi:hypothetical protein
LNFDFLSFGSSKDGWREDPLPLAARVFAEEDAAELARRRRLR